MEPVYQNSGSIFTDSDNLTAFHGITGSILNNWDKMEPIHWKSGSIFMDWYSLTALQ